MARMLIPLNLSGTDVRILLDQEKVTETNPNRFRGLNLETATIEIPAAGPENREVCAQLIDYINELLSFARGSRVGLSSLQFSPEQTREKRESLGSIETFRPVFGNGAEVKAFIDQVFPQYLQLRDPRKLNVVIDYLWSAARHGTAIEVKLITMFVLLENLKHSFAEEKGYPFIKGRFRSQGVTEQKPGSPKTFRGLVDEMYNEVGMPPISQGIIDARNDVIHSGLLDKSVQEKMDLLEEIIGLHRKYILRLLGYTGQFYDYSSNGLQPV